MALSSLLFAHAFMKEPANVLPFVVWGLVLFEIMRDNSTVQAAGLSLRTSARRLKKLVINL
jgi:hypothetical protein